MKPIEPGHEILACYDDSGEFLYGSREFRRQQILECFGFLCHCSECSLIGEALMENERKRVDIRKKSVELKKLSGCGKKSQMESEGARHSGYVWDRAHLYC